MEKKCLLFTRPKTLTLIFLLTSICHLSSFISIWTSESAFCIFNCQTGGLTSFWRPGRGTSSPNTQLPCDSLALCAGDFHHDFLCVCVCVRVLVLVCRCAHLYVSPVFCWFFLLLFLCRINSAAPCVYLGVCNMGCMSVFISDF